MLSLPVISQTDYSFRRFGAMFSRYHAAAELIAAGQVGRDPSALLYDQSESIYGISAAEFQFPVSQEEAEKLTPYLIALEDKRFWMHRGVDWRAALRAAAANVRNRQIVQGGSTLTMQLVRNTLIASHRSFLRKSIEAGLARKLEKSFSKQEIIRLYCEQVYMGRGLRGLQSAAYFIYRKPILRLDKMEICGLLGMLRSPSAFNPMAKQTVEIFARRQQFIADVLEVAPSASEAPAPNPIRLQLQPRERHARYARQTLKQNATIPPTAIRRVGTTIDRSVQKRLDATVKEELRPYPRATMSALILRHADGSIMAESSWQGKTQMGFSPILEGRVQPGSTYKTFALIAALEQGFGLDLELLSAPYASPSAGNTAQPPWTVANYRHVYRGAISLLDAFVHSDNTAFARLTEILDLPHLYSVYRRFGLVGANHSLYPSVVLGATKTGKSMLDVALAYRALANNGVSPGPARFVRYFQFYNGAVGFTSPPQTGGQAIIASDSLSAARQALAAAARSYGIRGMFGKTGTSDSGRMLVVFDEERLYAFFDTVEKYRPRFAEFMQAWQSGETDKSAPIFPRLLNKLMEI